MAEAVDPVTTALTGMLPFYLLIAAAVTWPISRALLRLYTRAVRRSMRSSVRGGAESAAPVTQSAGTAVLHDLPDTATSESAERLAAQLLSRPWRVALVYAAAGVAYALAMAAAQLGADRLEFFPLRFLFLFWIAAWPIVLTIGIVAATTRRAKMAATALYGVGFLAISAAAMRNSPDASWGQAFIGWVMFNLPPTLLLVTYLSRRVRAVGPLILTFVLLALIGSDVAIKLAGSDDSYLRAIISVTSVIGLGGVGTFFGLMAVGFVLFGVLGWGTLIWIGRRYQSKQMSDESVTVDAVWALFTVLNSINLVFGGLMWALAGVAAFVLYKVGVRIGFALLAKSVPPDKSPSLLVLRSFSIGGDSERLFDVIGRHWRRVGSIQMIAGVDLLSRTVEPHEFLEFVSGRLSRRFVDGADSLDRRMRERDVAPDRDLRFRVNEFFCYDDTWKMVLTRLVQESDAVLMDLRGFSRENAGCVFELHELARVVPLERVVFVTDRRTDATLLAQTLGAGHAGVFRFDAMRRRELRQLMRALAAAASPLPRVAA